MEKTPHNFLGFEGAMIFARRCEFPILQPGALITDYAKEALKIGENHKKVEE